MLMLCTFCGEYQAFRRGLCFLCQNEEPDEYDGEVTTCQGCGAYSGDFGTHVRNGEECGQFL